MSLQSKWADSSRLVSFTILTFLILIPLTTHAADTWSGNLPDGTRVELNKNVNIDNKTFDYGLHYMASRACRIGANKESSDNKTIKLNVDVTSGGICDCLIDAKMSIQLVDNEPHSVAIESVCNSKIPKRCPKKGIDCNSYKEHISLQRN